MPRTVKARTLTQFGREMYLKECSLKKGLLCDGCFMDVRQKRTRCGEVVL